MRMLAALGLAGFLLSLGAQQPAETPLPTFTPEENLELLPEIPVDPATYVLAPGDSLLVAIAGSSNYSYATMVTPGGELLIETPTGNPLLQTESGTLPIISPSRLNLDVADQVAVAGQTLAAAAETADRAVGRYLRNVRARLILLRPRRFKVFVLGEVAVPGAYIATPFLRVSDLIGKAEGLTPNGSRRHIELRRVGATRAVDLEQYQRRGTLDQNPPLAGGDVILVPVMGRKVLARGAFYSRSTEILSKDTLQYTIERYYEIEDGETFGQVIDRAGGVATWADLRHAYVERLVPGRTERKRIPVDLYGLIVEHDASKDVVLADGDVLAVPRLDDVVYVTGQVRSPGSRRYTESMRVLDYLGLAGGVTSSADLARIRVIRADGREVSARGNPVVERGDTVFVPDRALVNWQLFLALGATIITTVYYWVLITR